MDAMTSTTETWAQVDRGRRVVVDLLTPLTPEQWATPSLCAGWTVRDVAGHMTMLLMSTPALLGLALRHPGGTNRLIREGSREIARRHATAEIVTQLGRLIGTRRTFPGLNVDDVHVDLLAHTLDMAVPLGIPVDLPVDELGTAADNALAFAAGRKGKVFEHLPLDSVTLMATDTDWRAGAGPEVRGAMADLYLLVTGRPAGLAKVAGPGVAVLRR